MDKNEIMKRIEEKLGSRLAVLVYQILMLSMSGQPCNITFFKKDPVRLPALT